MRKLEQYRVHEGKTPLSGPELSERFFDIDGRLHQLELLNISWQGAIAELQNHGLERINSVIAPLLDQAHNLVDLAQQSIDAVSQEWQAILDGWSGIQGVIDGLNSDIATLQTDLGGTQSDIADLQASVNELQASSEPIRFAQMGAVSVQTDIVKIPAGVPLTLSKISVIVGTAPSGGSCSIVLKKNGSDNIFINGVLSVAAGTGSASTTDLQNNQLAATDFIQVDVTASNSAQDLMIVIEF